MFSTLLVSVVAVDWMSFQENIIDLFACRCCCDPLIFGLRQVRAG